MMTDMTISTTILEQLGGRQFIAMTGARNFVGHADALSFRLPGNSKDGANYVKITLTPMDVYNVETKSVRGVKVKDKTSREGVYADQLRDVFTTITGLYTSLGTMGR
jgi:hypothetical protein